MLSSRPLEIFAVFETIPTYFVLFPEIATPRHLLMQILQSLNPFELERLEDERISSITGKLKKCISCMHIIPNLLPFYLSLCQFSSSVSAPVFHFFA